MVKESGNGSRREPRQTRSKVTVERALAAAGVVLARVGFDGFSIEAVAAEAGISPGTLYQYFADKYAILRVLVEQWYNRSSPMFDLYRSENSIDAQAELYFGEPGGAVLLEAIQAVPELRRFDRETMNSGVDRLAKRFSKGRKPTKRQMAQARVTVFVVDAVLREATRHNRREAKEMVKILKAWMHALNPKNRGAARRRSK